MNKTNLPFPRIIISLGVFFLLPLCTSLLNSIVSSLTITNTLIISLTALVLTALNWDLLARHGRRFANDLKDGLLFTLVGLIVLGLLAAVNAGFLHAPVFAIEKSILLQYSFFIPVIILVCSLGRALNFTLAFKIFFDRIHLRVNESMTILVSGFLFGLCCTLVMMPISLDAFIRLFIYQFILSLLGSYLYNQTHSFVPMTLAYTLMLLTSSLMILL